MKKSKGHIAFVGGYEYYLSASGDLYRAHVSNVIASDTGRRHGRFEAPAHMVDKHPLLTLQKKGEVKTMTKEKLLEIIREMIAENWANSDLDARAEKVLTFIAENDYQGRDEDLEAFVDRINSAQTEIPALFIVQDALLYYSGWNFEKAIWSRTPYITMIGILKKL